MTANLIWQLIHVGSLERHLIHVGFSSIATNPRRFPGTTANPSANPHSFSSVTANLCRFILNSMENNVYATAGLDIK